MQFASSIYSRIQRLSVYLLWITFSALPQVSWAIEPTTITLKEALSLALNANPEIAVALREREAQQGAQLQAGVGPNPVFSAALQDVRSELRQTTLQISQEFELGDKRSARMAAADAFYNKANVELEAKKADIHANVVAAFYGVLVAQARVDLAKSALETAGLAQDAAAKRVKAGKSAPVEATKSNIAFSSANIELVQATSQLNNSRKKLTVLFGKNTSDNPLPKQAMQFNDAAGEVSHIPDIAALSTLINLLENAPAIQLARMNIAAQTALTSVERGKSTPNITVSAGIVNNQELGVNQALLGLSVPIPLFDRNRGGMQEAISRQYKAEDALSALKIQLEADLSEQHGRLSAAKQAALALNEEILPSAQSAFDVANKGFEFGKFSFLDVLDAQRTLFQVKSQYVTALAEAHLAVAEIERILGDVIQHPLDKTLE